MLVALLRSLPHPALRTLLNCANTTAMNRLFTAISSPPQRSKPPSAPRAILRHDAPTSATAFLQQLRADDGVVLGDADTVLHKLQRMYQGGLSSLHIVTDFGMVMEH